MTVVAVRVWQTVGRSAAAAQRNQLLVWVKAAAHQSTETRERWIIQSSIHVSAMARFVCVSVCLCVCVVHWQAGVGSDSGRVVGADHKVALLLGEVRRKLQVGHQVHHVVVTR